MFVALLLEGANLYIRDAFTRNLPMAFFLSDIAWAAALFSLVFYRRWPWVTLVFAWVLFLTSAIFLEPFSFAHTVVEFVRRNVFVLTNLILAHLGWYFWRKARLGLAADPDVGGDHFREAAAKAKGDHAH